MEVLFRTNCSTPVTRRRDRGRCAKALTTALVCHYASGKVLLAHLKESCSPAARVSVARPSA